MFRAGRTRDGTLALTRAGLPPGTQILSASRHGSDRWARSAKVVAKLPDGTVRPYFLRGSAGESGKQMMRGEYESLLAIWNVVPTFCPRPIGWGAFKSKPNTYYNLSVFHERVSSPPDPGAFATMLARLHTRSKSPDGRFGFPVATFFGEVLNERVGADSWEECFTAAIRHLLALDEEINGADEALVELREELIARVIPRLLRPLVKIKPALIHGDLCLSNAGIGDSDSVEGSGNVMVWRPAAMYAHNEFELGMWRAVVNGFDRRFLRAYLKQVPISEPKSDFEDRNALYALRHVIACSIRYPGSAKYRLAIADEMRALVRRFSPGPDKALPLPGVDEEETLVDEVDGDGATVLVGTGTVAPPPPLNKAAKSEKVGNRAKSKSIVGGKLVKRL
ncbi:Fructosamine kinase-domain-containing protein [Sphaerosporella brunnea]|uniref:protein-ribulosamine 3-kinase n=1 Tax=Sphaerosporella brunnea TaxID=1250544 RepID=A0A5J5EMZ2_9PEZI|nr:Fructosamine kinase-domain-containing protein [Sphaerosporella brunnea]